MNSAASEAKAATVRSLAVPIGGVYLVLAVAASAAAALWRRLPPHDLWWHMSMGRDIVRTGSVPTVDHWTFTRAGEPFFDQSWLAQVAFYRLYELGGLELVSAVNALLVAASVGLFLWACVLVTRQPRMSAIPFLAIAMPLCVASYMVRPQTGGVICFTASLSILLLHRWKAEDSRLLILLPVIAVLWANTHGSFVFAPVLAATFFVGDRWDARLGHPDMAGRTVPKGLGVVTIATLLATLVNPAGVRLWEFALSFPRHDTVRLLATEWGPTTPTDFDGIVFWLVAAAVVAALLWSRHWPNRVNLLLLLGFGLLAIAARRNTVWFGLTAAAVLTTHLAVYRPEPPEADVQGRVNAAIAIAAILAVIALLPWWRAPAAPGHPRLVGTDTPVAAVEHLRQLPRQPQRLFADMGYASYVTWATDAGVPVFMDGRLELYPEQQALDYAAMSAGLGVGPLLDTYDVDAILASRDTQAGLLSALEDLPQWQQVYADDLAVYLVRRDDGTGG